MPFRFRRSVRIAPGLTLNLGKKSASVRLGGRGFGYTVSTNGKQTTSIGLPGTGISWSKTTRLRGRSSVPTTSGGTVGVPLWHQPWIVVACLVLLPPIGIAMVWSFTTWPTQWKYVSTAVGLALTARLLIAAFSG